MAAFNELADDMIHDAALAEPNHVGAQDVRHGESEPAVDASDARPHDFLLQPASQACPNDRFRRGSHALVKSLIAMTTAQYVVVTALVSFAAVAVAFEAAQVINTKFDSIMLALKRF